MISVKEVYKTYIIKKSEYQALKGIDLEINRGEFVVIKGPSGSGKTTLLNLLGFLDKPTSGNIIFENKNPNLLKDSQLSKLRSDKIGFVFQNFNLISVFSAYENIAYPLILAKTLKTRKGNIRSLMSEMGILDLQNKRPDELSGGQQQRVAIARALVNNPSLVLADEPTANLDSVTGKLIIEHMKTICKKSNTTFVIATHDPVVSEYAERIIEIRDGKITKEITNEAQSNDYTHYRFVNSMQYYAG